MHSFVPHISTTLTTPLLLSLTRNEACRKNRSNRAGKFAFLRKRSSSSRIYIFFSLSLDATRVVLLRRRLIPETLIYISAFEPFFALDDVACAMRSRARSKKNRFGDGTRRRDAFARARKRGANGATSVARCRSGEDFASSVFFPRIFSFGSSSFWSRAIIIIIISMNNNEA